MDEELDSSLENEPEDVPQAMAEPGGWRRGLVIALALPMALAVGVMLWGILSGTWSINVGVRVPEGVPERIAALREEMAALGMVPRAVAWLDEALAPGIDGADVLAYVRAALDEVAAADDPRLADVEAQLREIVGEFGVGEYESSVTLPAVTPSAP